MINGIRTKICGITSRADAEHAYSCGADFLGFIQYPKSPRFLPIESYRSFLPDLPSIPKVGVFVYSSFAELEACKEMPFDYIQLHFPNDTPFFEVALWTEVIPPQRLWLAPRVPPGSELDLAFLPLADTFLVDAFDPQKMGGSGHTGDWIAFRRLKEKYQKVSWVLAGGLSPENICDALEATRASCIDVNSGVEMAPGKKDPDRVRALFDKLATVALS